MQLPYNVLPSLFTKYDLTDTEREEGYKLSSATIAVLTTLQATIAEEKNALTFTPNDVLSYAQQESYKAGQLAILTYVLDEAEAALTKVKVDTQSQEN